MNFSKIFIDANNKKLNGNVTDTLETQEEEFNSKENLKTRNYSFNKNFKEFPEFLFETKIKIKPPSKVETPQTPKSLETCSIEKKEKKEEKGTLSSCYNNNSNIESTLLVNSTICSPNRENSRKKNNKISIDGGYEALKIFYKVIKK